MSSRFAERMGRLNHSLDGEFGELFELRPMRRANVNIAPVPDEGREIVQVTGRYLAKHLARAAIDENARRKGTFHGSAQGSMTEPRVSIADTEFAGGPMPRQHDRLKQLATGVIFEISDSEPDGQSRTTYVLKTAGREQVEQ